MSDTPKKTTTLTLGKKLELKKPPAHDGDQVRQSFSHGRSKTVAVEVKRRRVAEKSSETEAPASTANTSEDVRLSHFTRDEIESRFRAVKQALNEAPTATSESQDNFDDTHVDVANESIGESTSTFVVDANDSSQAEVLGNAQEATKEVAPQEKGAPEAEPKRYEPKPYEPKAQRAPATARPVPSINSEITEPRIFKAAGYGTKPAAPQQKKPQGDTAPSARSADFDVPGVATGTGAHHTAASHHTRRSHDEDDDARKKATRPADGKRAVPPSRDVSSVPRKLRGSTLERALNDEELGRSRSLAAMRRAKQKHRHHDDDAEATKIVRDVTIPETISVADLANRMAVRGADVVKSLMKLGMMVTINQVIDADTAELVCSEFGHTPIRVSDSDVELGLRGEDDNPADLQGRAPIVTVMGHVDHGKTSLLDALRETDVVSGEAGGITQHIGAYQVTLKSGKKITFIDTPGHAAFTEMRARGANLTDVVVLVVAADDGIMPQTIEAINHAKAAKVPLVVAINKVDKPESNPDRVRNELLQHDVVLESFGGEVLAVEVSAKKRMNLDKLEEAILLQAEVLDLKANANRQAEGVVIESKVDRGRGMVATVLVQRGTLRVGDIFVAGKEWGRVRAINNDHGQKILEATPGMPVEILGLNGLPVAGDELVVVQEETKAREIAEYRDRKGREAKSAASAKSNMEKMLSQIAAGNTKELAVVIKTDVQGSLEALSASLMKLSNDEVAVRVLHGAVGGINESDVTLARASSGIIIGFNVRANPQARDLARRDAVDIRYYSIIYNAIDDIKAALGGLLSPDLKEKFLGYAQIREVFNVTKVGKIAGCYVTEGNVKRGAKVRLLRDDVVIHEGTLKTLRRFKEEVREVKESFECGMAFENYDDIKIGDMIECFEVEEIARVL